MIESYRSRPGCLVMPVLLIVGVLIGAAGMAAFLGIGLNEIVARANGRAAPVLVEVTPVPAMQVIGGAAPGRRLVWRRPIPLDSDTSEPELLVISRNYDRGSDTLMLYSPDAGRISWESPPLGENGNTWLVTFSPGTVIIADEATLIGISRANGAKLWEAPLTDRIFYNGCRDCLQAFDVDTGAPRWNVRLNQAPRQMLRVGDRVAVPDSLTKDDSEAGLFIYNTQDGTLERTIEPSCQLQESSYEDRPHYYDRVLTDPDSGALYWMLDSASCLLRLGTGTFGGEARIFDQRFSSFDEDNVLIANGVLYMSFGDEIYALDQQGVGTTLVSSADYNLIPLEARADALLLLAQRTRGSSRLELWLIDSQSGQQRWAHPLQARDPLLGPFDSGEFSAHIAGDAVALIEQSGDPKELRLELLNLINGTSKVSTALRVADAENYLRGITWGDRAAWVAFDELYGVSLEDGATISRWP